MRKIIAITLLSLLVQNICFAFQKDREEYNIQNNVVAHRGAWKKHAYPENSLASLRRAIELKCAGSEFDVRITLDDSLIIMHDPSYHGLSIENNTYARLNETKLSNGENIPTLRDYLIEGQKNNKGTRLVCEIKPSESGTVKGQIIAEKTVALVNRIGAKNDVIYISFDYNIIKKIKEIDADAHVQYLEGNRSPESILSDLINTTNYHYSVYQRKPDWISEAKMHGVKLNAWTVNNPEIMDWLIQQDFNFITTDEPEILLRKYFELNHINHRTLVWNDEFSRDGLPDSQKWSYDTHGNNWGWGNNELQWYTASRPENAKVIDGILRVTAEKEIIEGKKYSSARLVTKGQGDWKYAVVEVRAKLPKGNGTWPAIWMLPTNSKEKWPLSGEIDIMEHVGYNPDSVFSTVHTGANNHLKGTQVGETIYMPQVTDDFHTYSLVWDENSIRSFVDGIHYFTYPNFGKGEDFWPFDQEYYLILNLAIGGGLGGKMGVDNSLFPHFFEVDFVRVYQ